MARYYSKAKQLVSLLEVVFLFKVYLTDILYNETALFHFMEFMETEGRRVGEKEAVLPLLL